MFVKQKKLMAKCRACGNEQQLDSMHRAGTQLMKNVPTDMDEIGAGKKKVKPTAEEAKQPEAEQPKEPEGDEEVKEKKKKKKKKVAEGATPNDEVAQVPEEVGILKLDSEEIGKYLTVSKFNDEYLVTTTDNLND